MSIVRVNLRDVVRCRGVDSSLASAKSSSVLWFHEIVLLLRSGPME